MKNYAKRLRAKKFAIAKLVNRNLEKINNLIIH